MVPLLFLLALIDQWTNGPRYTAQGSNMVPTLEVGEAFRSVAFTDDRPPMAGDIVVFTQRFETGQEADFVFRIVGMPGDRVQVVEGMLWINGTPVATERLGEAVDERGRGATRYRETLPNGVTYEIIDMIRGMSADDTEIFLVPDAHYFVLGDNRDNSLDSRLSRERGGRGFVERDALIGRVEQ